MGAKWVNSAIERGPKYFIPPVTDTGAQERVENYSIAAAGNGKLHKCIYTSLAVLQVLSITVNRDHLHSRKRNQ